MTASAPFREGGPEDAPALALLWAQAEARRKGERVPSEVDDQTIQALRARLDDSAAVAVVRMEGAQPVAACFATEARFDGVAARGRAHVSGGSVHPDLWGQGLATLTLGVLEDVLATRGFDTAQLHVLESNRRARSLYERTGWSLVRTGEPHPAGPHAVYEKRMRSRPAE